MSNTATEHLPWQKSTSLGYSGLDLTLVIGSNIGTIAVKRCRPDDASDPDAGKYLAWHNDNRISDNAHARRVDAQAEAERYLYALPQFKGSVTAAMIMALVETGRQAFRDGKSLDQNPHNMADPNSRNQWFTGWLEVFAANAASKAINTATATAQANQQLNSDLNYTQALLTIYKLAMQFALSEEINDGARFLRLFIQPDGEKLLAEFYPGWQPYVSEQTGGTITVGKTAVN